MKLCLVFLSAILIAASARADTHGRYGEKTKFSKGARIAFPDFVLEYTGEHRQSSEKYPRGFLFYDFLATFDGSTVPFSWSSGTGDIGPATFGFHEQHYSLELKRSDKLGPMKDDELVVWKKGDSTF